MNKKILLWIFVVICLSSMAFAYTPYKENNLYGYWTFNETGNDLSSNNYDLTKNTNMQYISGDNCFDNLLSCVNQTGTTDTGFVRTSTPTRQEDMTWQFVVTGKYGSGTYNRFYTYRTSATRNYEMGYIQDTDKIYLNWGAGTTDYKHDLASNGFDVPSYVWDNYSDDWSVIHITYNNTNYNYTFYLNGIQVHTEIGNQWRDYTQTFYLMSDYCNGCTQGTAGSIGYAGQHFGRWNQSFSSDEVLESYNYLINQEGHSNLQFNTNDMNFNASVNSNITFNCSLYINNTLNQTTTYPSGDINVSFNSTLSDGLWSYYITCNPNGTTQNVTDITFFYIDTINPVIVTNFINNSVIYDLLDYNFNFTDDESIYSFNISLDGTNIASLSNILTTSYNYNLNYNLENISSGEHTLSVRLADGHTAKELKSDYKIKDGLFNNYLEFEVYSRKKIKLYEETESILDSWSTERKIDRYSFKYKPNKIKDKYNFIVEAEEVINIVEKEDSKYKKWLIIGDHWLDFYPYQDITITKVDDYKVFVEIKDAKGKELEFNSIGDLNIVVHNYTFYNIIATTTYDSTAFETEDQTITFNVSKPDLTYTTQASIIYDGTSYSFDKFINNDHDYYSVTFTTSSSAVGIAIFNVSFNVSNSTSIVLATQNLNYTQQVNQINIGDCSNSSWTEALTFYIKDEETNEPVIADLNIDFDVWYTTESLYRDFSFGFSGQNNYSICIFPNSSSYSINSVMEYDTTDYSNRKYYLVDYELDNISDSVYLYLLNDSKSTNIELHVYDSTTGANIEGAYVKIQRYYPEGNGSDSGGVYRTVEIEKTGIDGKTQGKMVYNDVFYKYIVDYNGVTRLNTGVSRTISTLKLLPITLFDDVFESAEIIGNVAIDVTCTESTKICRVTWNDPENIVQTVKFEVYRQNMYGKVLIYSDETSSVSGSMVYTITEDTTGNEYRAVAHIKTNTAYSWYNSVAEAILNFKANFSSWGGVGALFSIMIFMIAVVFIMLEIAGATGVVIGSLIVLILLSVIGVLQLTWYNLIILVALGAILIGRLRR